MFDNLDSDALIKVIMNVYLKRAKVFYRLSQHIDIQNCANIIKKMSNLEYSIFNDGREINSNYRTWKNWGVKNIYLQKLKKVH